MSSESDPIAAGEADIIYYSNRTIPYGQNLFFEPVPFEMLRTYETQPQLIVSVGDLPAVCHNLTCDFTYIEAEGQVTDFSFDESSMKLII